MRAAVILTVLLAACSAKQTTDRDVPQCLSLCANQFAACTEEFPGDASACLPGRNECERTCEGEAAVRRAEGGQEGLFAPVEKPTMIRPDAGAPSTDMGSAGD